MSLRTWKGAASGHWAEALAHRPNRDTRECFHPRMGSAGGDDAARGNRRALGFLKPIPSTTLAAGCQAFNPRISRLGCHTTRFSGEGVYAGVSGTPDTPEALGFSKDPAPSRATLGGGKQWLQPQPEGIAKTGEKPAVRRKAQG